MNAANFCANAMLCHAMYLTLIPSWKTKIVAAATVHAKLFRGALLLEFVARGMGSNLR